MPQAEHLARLNRASGQSESCTHEEFMPTALAANRSVEATHQHIY